MAVMSIPEFLQNVQYQIPTEKSTMPSLDFSSWEIVKSINEFNTNTKTFFETVTKVVYYFTHPKTLAWVMWTGLVKYSFWICLFICLFSIIAYIIGWEKGKSWAKGSVISYVIIMMFNSAL